MESSCDICKGTGFLLEDRCPLCEVDDPYPPCVAITVRTFSGVACTLSVDHSCTVGDLKLAIQGAIGVEAEAQVLVYDSQQLGEFTADDLPLAKTVSIGSSMDLTLVRRSIEQIEEIKRWITRASEVSTPVEAKLLTEAFAAAEEHIRKSRDVVLAVVSCSGMALEHVAEPLKADRHIVFAAVKSQGCALRFASDPLRDDRDIALAAVASNSAAYQYVSAALRSDLTIRTISVLWA